jgi:hypothetical protein
MNGCPNDGLFAYDLGCSAALSSVLAWAVLVLLVLASAVLLSSLSVSSGEGAAGRLLDAMSRSWRLNSLFAMRDDPERTLTGHHQPPKPAWILE